MCICEVAIIIMLYTICVLNSYIHVEIFADQLLPFCAFLAINFSVDYVPVLLLFQLI